MGDRWMIYGAYGYTGKLVAEVAKERGLSPVLAGRRADAVEPMGQKYGWPTAVFSLDDRAAAEAALGEVDAVLHCAGPFSATSKPMVDACLATKTHYLDITGEIAVFEAVHGRSDAAREAGVTLIPGVGFDVVPTDAMAAMLAARMPDATELDLAFVGLSSSSAGTTKTMVEGLPEGGRARIDGVIQRVPNAWRSKEIPFADKSRRGVSIPWGDVSTAFYTTGIPNITTYLAMPPSMEKATKVLSRLSPLLALGPVQSGLKRLVELTVKGPTDAERRAGRSEIWGEVRNAKGDRVWGTMTTPEGYELTADSCVEAMKLVLAGVEHGALTPSLAFGRDFVTGLKGVTVHGIHEG